MIEEVWKDITGYEGYYQVSNLGRVKSIERTILNTKRKSVILSQAHDKDGYCVTTISKEGKAKQYRTHRLVAQAFLDNPNHYKMVNHKDENKQNNNVNNLEWCDNKYNLAYGTGRRRAAIARSGEKSHLHKLTVEMVREIRTRYKRRSKDANALVLAKEYGIAEAEVLRIVQKTRWKWVD